MVKWLLQGAGLGVRIISFGPRDIQGGVHRKYMSH